MPRTPPLLPEETLLRVTRVSQAHGTAILVMSGLFAVLAALIGDTVGAVGGLLVAGAGAMERHGGMLLEHGDARGVRWAFNAELFALFAILAYCQVRALTIDPALVRAAITPDMKAKIAQAGMSVEDFLGFVNRIVVFTVGLVALFYQGGMALYYLRRKRAVDTALANGTDV